MTQIFEISPVDPTPPPTLPQLSSAVVTSLDVQVAFDPRYEQVWTMQKLSIGDLASTMSLAPLERLVIEVKTSQRTTFERSALDSVESLESTEATLHDTDTVNVAKSNTTTTNWHVDGQGSISGGIGSLGVQAGYSKSVTNTSSYSQNRITERTQKSANSLKTLHKIEIKGASESIIQDRQLRTLRNPYRDRALVLNFFQLLKNFNVTTSLVESRLAIVIRVADMVMDEGFVVANVDFLTQHLLDDALRTNLAQAVSAAQPGALGEPIHQTAVATAQKALEFLFGGQVDASGFVYPNIFDLPAVAAQDIQVTDFGNLFDDAVFGSALGQAVFGPLGGLVGGALSFIFGSDPPKIHIPAIDAQDRNDPNKSFVIGTPDGVTDSALVDALGKKLGNIFAILSFFYRLTRDPIMSPTTNGNNAIRIAMAIAAAVSPDWNGADMMAGFDKKGQDFLRLMLVSHKMEVFRRLPGFLAMVEQMLTPMVTKSADDAEAARQDALRVLGSLLAHLGFNKNYYIQRFLEYQTGRTHGQSTVDLATDVMGRLLAASNPSSTTLNNIRGTITDFDVQAAFVDKQNIVIPDSQSVASPLGSSPTGPSGLTAAQLAQVGVALGLTTAADPTPIVFPAPLPTLIQIPTDGVHLEVAGGLCILDDVPDKPLVQADLNFGPSSVSISED